MIKNAAINNAAAILVLHDVIHKHFYEVDLATVSRELNMFWMTDDMLDRLSFPVTLECKSSLNTADHKRLQQAFYGYYFSRLDFLFRYVPVTSGRRRLVPNPTEIDLILRAVFACWDREHPDTDYERIGRDRAEVLAVCHWYVSSTQRARVIYDLSWLWGVLASSHPLLSAPTGNPLRLWRQVVTESSRQFWGQLEEIYLKSLWTHHTFGHFTSSRNEPIDWDAFNEVLGPGYHLKAPPE